MTSLGEIKRLFDHISPIESEAWQKVIALIDLKELEKGELLVCEGASFENEGMVTSGLLRTCVSANTGEDYTLDFYKEGEVLSPYFSRTYENRSIVSIMAMEKSTVALFETTQFSRLRYNYDSLLQFGNRVTEGELFRKTSKEIAMATATAKERYALFRKRYPGLENRIPQHVVASYLGVSPVSLSRLRAQSID